MEGGARYPYDVVCRSLLARKSRGLRALLCCLPYIGWQSVAGFEANGVGQTPSNSGAPMSTSSPFCSLKSYVERLNYYYITLNILEIFFYNYFYLIYIL